MHPDWCVWLNVLRFQASCKLLRYNSIGEIQIRCTGYQQPSPTGVAVKQSLDTLTLPWVCLLQMSRFTSKYLQVTTSCEYLFLSEEKLSHKAREKKQILSYAKLIIWFWLTSSQVISAKVTHDDCSMFTICVTLRAYFFQEMSAYLRALQCLTFKVQVYKTKMKQCYDLRCPATLPPQPQPDPIY